MKTFTIENETNNITNQDGEAVANVDNFRTEAQLAKLVADWPAARLVEIWNSLPGETEVKKFKDRATANQQDEAAVKIAREFLEFDTLETRKRDSIDSRDNLSGNSTDPVRETAIHINLTTALRAGTGILHPENA